MKSFVYLLLLLPAGFSYPASIAEENSGLGRTVLLRPCKTTYFRINFDYRFDKALPPFEQEIDFHGKDIVRGFIPTVPPSPFIRDLSKQELCLSSERSGVFTKDSTRRYASARDAVGHIIFHDIQVSTIRDDLEIPYTLNLYTYEGVCSGWLIVRSGWQGSLYLDGTEYLLCIIDNLDGRIDNQDTFSILRADEQTFSSNVHPVPQTLFLEGHVFDLNFTFISQSNEVVLEATLTETHPPLGTLDIKAVGCGFIYLQGEQTAISLDSPMGQIAVPTGRYRLTDCILKHNATLAGTPCFSRFDHDVIIRAGQITPLTIGLPLEHHVVTAHNKNLVTLTYQLLGSGGEVYTYNIGHPEFAVYKGPVKVGGGRFGFG